MATKEKNMIRRRLVRSYITSVISISLVLTLVGASAIFWINADNIARYFKENVTFSLIMKQHVAETEASAMADSLSKCEQVKSATFISKAQGAEELKGLLGEDFLDVFETTPVPASIDIKFDGDLVDGENLALLRSNFEKDERIEEVAYQETLVEALNANLSRITLILSIVIGLLLIISFALINNTVRLNIYSRRFTIHTMRLVGAKNSFIRKPFLRQAVFQGGVSGILAAAIIAGGVYYVRMKSPLMYSIFDPKIIGFTLAALVLTGIIICMISAFSVVSHLAYSSKDDLYF